MGVMICLGQGGLRSLSASSLLMYLFIYLFDLTTTKSVMPRASGAVLWRHFRLKTAIERVAPSCGAVLWRHFRLKAAIERVAPFLKPSLKCAKLCRQINHLIETLRTPQHGHRFLQ